MKTEVKMGLALFAALVVVVCAAYFYPHKDGTTADNAEVVPSPTGGAGKPVGGSTGVTPGLTEPLPNTGIVPSSRPTTIPVDIFPPTHPSTEPAPTTEPAGPAIKADWDSLVGSKSGTGGARPGGPTMDFGGTGPGSSGGKKPVGEGLSGNTYTVKKGDTFSVISTAVYGSPNYWSKIAAANPGVSSSKLKIGQVIKVPPVSEVKPSETDLPKHTPVGGSSLVADSSSEYAVQAGDTLTKISQKLYGNGNRADAIYKLNKAKIGASPNRLKVGMVLKLPTAPKTPATLPSR